MEEQSNKETPKWLKHLQENSWEAEILISGGAIFSLFQLVDLLISFRQSLIETSQLFGTNEVLVVLVLILQGVTIGFLYLDRIPSGELVRWACIQSDFIKDDFVKVFVPYKAWYDQEISKKKNKVLSEIVTLSLNDSVRVNPEWLRYLVKSSNQYGIVAYVPIAKLPKGKNELTVQIQGMQFFYSQEKLVIPFWKE